MLSEDLTLNDYDAYILTRELKDKIYKDLGAAIRVEREKSNLSQTSLATLLGIDKQTVYSYEKGHTPVSVARLFAIAQVMRCNIFDFTNNLLKDGV